MDINKEIGNWNLMLSTYLDDLAYFLYVDYIKEHIVLHEVTNAVLNQKSFKYWGTHEDKNQREELDMFYNQARLLIRNEKIEKIKTLTNY